MNLYSFKPHDHVRVERETLAEISHAYVGYCSARSTFNHASVKLLKGADVIGYIHPDGKIFAERKAGPLPVLYDPAAPQVQPTDVLATALRCDDLVDTYAMIVTALGIENTNVVFESFTVADRATYGRLPNAYQKATFIASWLTAELQAAAERIHG